MKKTIPFLAFTLLIACLLITCKNRDTGFSPGAGDSRIIGTWRLYERHFSKDSVFYNYSFVVDSTRGKDSTRIDTVRTSRDTSFYTTKRYTTVPAQTLTFSTDGALSGNGTEMTYYAPIKYYLVDKTYQDSLLVNFYINTNRANVFFKQGLELRQDTLLLKPFCDKPCYSKLIRVR